MNIEFPFRLNQCRKHHPSINRDDPKFLLDYFSETELVTWPFKKIKLTVVISGNPKLD